MPAKLVVGLLALLAGQTVGDQLSTAELDSLARDFGYSRVGVGAWQPPPPPAAETVSAVVRRRALQRGG